MLAAEYGWTYADIYERQPADFVNRCWYALLAKRDAENEAQQRAEKQAARG